MLQSGWSWGLSGQGHRQTWADKDRVLLSSAEAKTRPRWNGNWVPDGVCEGVNGGWVRSWPYLCGSLCMHSSRVHQKEAEKEHGALRPHSGLYSTRGLSSLVRALVKSRGQHVAPPCCFSALPSQQAKVLGTGRSLGPPRVTLNSCVMARGGPVGLPLTVGSPPGLWTPPSM